MAMTAVAKLSNAAAVPDVGCAFFDDPDHPVTGWCSFNGSAPQRFPHVSELPHNIAWITNVNFGAYKNLADLSKAAHIRRNFFRPAFNSIAMEIGYKPETWPIRSALPDMSGVFFRAWDFAVKAWGGVPLLESLRESLYIASGERDQPVFGERENALSSSWQVDSVVINENTREPGMLYVRLIPNRVRHAAFVLANGMPRGEYFVRGKMTVDQALSADEPMFLECDVSFSGSDLAPLCAFGVSSSNYDQMRRWVSQPELMLLADHAKSIEITGAMVYEDFSDAPQLPPAFFEDDLIASSYSAGLIAESWIEALTSRQYSKTSRRYYHPPRAAWLKSLDRAISFGNAKRVHECGLRVVRYGYGTVAVKAFQHEMEEVRNAAADCGFMIIASADGVD